MKNDALFDRRILEITVIREKTRFLFQGERAGPSTHVVDGVAEGTEQTLKEKRDVGGQSVHKHQGGVLFIQSAGNFPEIRKVHVSGAQPRDEQRPRQGREGYDDCSLFGLLVPADDRGKNPAEENDVLPVERGDDLSDIQPRVLSHHDEYDIAVLFLHFSDRVDYLS